MLTLVSANNGSIGPNRNFVLSIQPNDNPHGTVQFSASQYNVTEQNTNSVQYLTLTRRYTSEIIILLRFIDHFDKRDNSHWINFSNLLWNYWVKGVFLASHGKAVCIIIVHFFFSKMTAKIYMHEKKKNPYHFNYQL